jgi:hypothetical protein
MEQVTLALKPHLPSLDSFTGDDGTLAVAITLTTLAATVVYLVLTRLVFHPLAGVPGPRLAGLTGWYEFYYDVIRNGQYVKHIEELHAKYSKQPKRSIPEPSSKNEISLQCGLGLTSCNRAPPHWQTHPSSVSARTRCMSMTRSCIKSTQHQHPPSQNLPHLACLPQLILP